MAQSVHTARWVGQLRKTGWDIHVFDNLYAGDVCSELEGVTAYTFYRPWKSACRVKSAECLWPLPFGANFVRRCAPSVARLLIKPRVDVLVELVRSLKPDIIHSLEMQHESYPLLEVKRRLGASFSAPWIYSSWGSDLYLFGNHPEHSERIKSVLNECDYYIADCQRDVQLARRLGFRGEVLGVFPGVGGFDTASMRKRMMCDRPSRRRVIALKGYEGWAGRALVGIRAMGKCGDSLQGYKVEIYSAESKVRSAARSFTRATGVPVRIIRQSPSVEIVKLMGRARIAIGLSISDGTPNSMLEAMVLGALPIQSDTISTREWIRHGENGLLVPPEDPEAVAAAIRRGVSDDKLVDDAAELNAGLAAECLDESVIQPKIIAAYERAAVQGKASMKRTAEGEVGGRGGADMPLGHLERPC